jgi:putative FmdB family regulatory protein
MPIYEYACPTCGADFEAFLLRRSDEAEVACPACHGRTVTRRMSRPAAMRGSGSSQGGSPGPGCGPVG